MQLSTIIPKFLFTDRQLLAVYCFFLRLVQPDHTKILVKGHIIPLKPYEVLVTDRDITQDLESDSSELKSSLQKLADLDLIEFQHNGETYRVRFKSIVLPNTQHTSKTNTVTDMNDCWFDEFISEYLEYIKTNMAPKTYVNYEQILTAFSQWLGRKKISVIAPTDLERYKNQRKGTVSDQTINIHIRTLKAALELAKKWSKVQENPFRAVKLIRTPKQSTPSLTKDEYILLRNNMSEQWLINIVDFAILTGLRLGELSDLKWLDLDLEKGIITIQSTQEYHVKHGKMRVLPLHPEAITLLKGLQKTGDYVFLKEDSTRPLPQFISKKFKAYVRASGLPEKYHFHSLRATFATWCANTGVSMYTLQNLMGHSSIKVTESYASPDFINVKKELSKISLS